MFVSEGVFQEYLTHNGAGFSATGEVGSALMGMRFEPGFSRPYLDKNGRPAVTVNTGRWTVEKGERRPVREHVLVRDVINNMGLALPVYNATMLRKEEWLELDRQVLRAARYRLRAWADLSAANSYGGFNGMSKMILEHETMADVGEAIVDMNGITEGRVDAPKFQLEGLPLPVTHTNFWFDARKLAASRNTGTPLDVTTGEMGGRRIAEAVEKTTIGIQTGLVYGGNSTQTGGYGRTSQVYGYTNFPSRVTKTGYSPSGNGRATTGWVPQDTLLDVLAAIDSLRAHKFYGPFMLYHSNDWDQYLDRDYFISSTASGTPISTKTLRQRLAAIGNDETGGEAVIAGVRRLDMLFSSTTDGSGGGPGLENLAQAYPFAMLLVQMTPDVCRAVNGMDITTVQWETKGGMQLNFKILCIQVPQLRADFYGNCGICHMTCSS